MVLRDVNAVHGWEVYAVYAYIQVSLGTNGTLSVSNNKMVASNVTVSYYKWQVYDLYITGGRSTYICRLDNSSTLDVSSNDLAVSNTTIQSSWERGALYITPWGGVVGLSDNSTINVSVNTLTALKRDDGLPDIRVRVLHPRCGEHRRQQRLHRCQQRHVLPKCERC